MNDSYRYCTRCRGMRHHHVISMGDRNAEWFECAGCQKVTRRYNLKKRPWAGK